MAAAAAAAGGGPASDSLEAFLLDFDHAVRDLEPRAASARHEPPAEALSKRAQGSLCDSGIEDSDGKSISPSSSLNSSEEDLRAGVASSETPGSTAKLGDTRELEAFIADLDQILKDENLPADVSLNGPQPFWPGRSPPPRFLMHQL